MTPGFRLRLPYPPTVNTYWRSVPVQSGSGRPSVKVLISGRGRAYRSEVKALCTAEMLRSGFGGFPEGPLRVELAVEMPDRRKRDLDNLLKGLLDAIGHAGVYGDDSQIARLEVERLGVRKPGGVTVGIFQWLERRSGGDDA